MVTQEESSKQKKRNNSLSHAVHSNRGNNIIRLPIDLKAHNLSIEDSKNYVTFLEKYIEQYPHLFPNNLAGNFGVHDCQQSKKLGFSYYRIKDKKTKKVYRIYPCNVLSYMMGMATTTVSNGLLLMMYGVPIWLIIRILGKHEGFWQRLFLNFGKCSVVGTTVYDAANLPTNLVADEKITWLNGREIYAAMMVGNGCILGNGLSLTEDEKGLTAAYGQFKTEALNVNPDYMPQSCTVDGWQSSFSALRALFPKMILLLCFLHSVLKIRNVCKKEPEAKTLLNKVWKVYKSKNINELDANIIDLKAWSSDHLTKESVKLNVTKLCDRKDRFAVSFDVPTAPRTTSMVDRIMRPFDKFLFNRMYFHGHFATAQRTCTAFAICHNFMPFAPRTKAKNSNHANCRADELNGVALRNDWLENLLVATSRNGFR